MINPLKTQARLIHFALVGATAATTHLIIVFFLVQKGNIHALIANAVAFLFAFNISYLGHRNLSFANMENNKILSLPHFFVVAASAGIINELLYYLILSNTNLHYMSALCCVLVLVSCYSFLVSKYWACR